jgi:hydroxymethylpyrimidine/phosphomethylpyrimidine kinase
MSVRQVLTIAGSDSSGGAGIQADLKTFAALGVYGASAITAITAQNTQGVQDIHIVPSEIVAAQIRSVFDDLDISAVKIGMLGTAEVVEVTARELERVKPDHIVLDPVMAATSGDALADLEAVDALKRELLPLASLVTPNIVETAVLAQSAPVTSPEDMRRAARDIIELGAKAVLVKGGDLGGEASPDCLHDGNRAIMLEATRVATGNAHGSGCTLSSAIAANLAKGCELEDAVRQAKAYVTAALKRADELDIGKGAGPLHHFHDLWPGRGRHSRQTR